MNAGELLRALQSRGLVVWAEGGELVFRGSVEVLTPAALSTVRQAKGELLALLSEEEAAGLARAGLRRCSRCRRLLQVKHLRRDEATGDDVCTARSECRGAAIVAGIG